MRPCSTLCLAAGVICCLAGTASAQDGGLHGTFPAEDTFDPAPDERPDAQELLRDVGYPPARFEVESELQDAEWDALVSFPSAKPTGSAQNDAVIMEWYAARARDRLAEDAPAVLVMHILDGRFRVARTVARFLSVRGVHAFVMHQPYYGRRGSRAERRDPELLVPRLRQAVADARRGRDAIAALPRVDRSRIGIQGTSLGGFVATLAAATDGAFDRVFLLLAGAEMHSLLVEGGQDAAKVRRAMLRAGMDEQQIEDFAWAIEPARIAHRLDPERTWLYSGLFDETVPPKNASALARAASLPDEHHLWLPGGHYSVAVFGPRLLQEVLDRMRSM